MLAKCSQRLAESGQLDVERVVVHACGVSELPGLCVRLLDRELDDLGVCHAPAPVREGDVVALTAGMPLVVVDVVELAPGGRVQALAIVRELAVVAR